MRSPRTRRLAILAGAPLLASFGLVAIATPATASPAASTVSRVGTASPSTGVDPAGTGDYTGEFPGASESDGGPGAYNGVINDRSKSNGTGKGGSAANGGKAKSNPAFQSGFQGLNHYQQRYSRRGNQFSVAPPDQALCVGNGYEVEAVNDVFNVFNASGQSALPDNTATNIVAGYPRNVNHAVDLNSFLGYPAAINRSTGVHGPFVTDPTCIFDAATQRFFLVVLTLETTPSGADTHVNHLDLAVTQTADPTGNWNIYRLDVTNDGSNPDPSNACPCLGDYPHIGADANGVYVTTNAYPWNGNGFDGAQIYAFSKRQLAAGAASVNEVHIDTQGAVAAPSDAPSNRQPGFTVWPAQSPGTASFATANNGTEFFLSSNAADEAQKPVAGTNGTHTSNQLVVWSLANTLSLDTAPAVSLSNRIVNVNQYGVPPKQQQPGSGTSPGENAPLGHCINDTTTETVFGTGCYNLVTDAPGNEVISRPDANDTRMQQVTYANGKLWGALDTAVNPNGGAQRAGIGWYVLNPGTPSVVQQGYVGAAGYDFTYPTIGVTASGRGVMGFTLTGSGDGTSPSYYPSAGYAPIDAKAGVGAWNVVPGGAGAAPDDSFDSYVAEVGDPPRTRWGDYGAAAVDGNSVWLANEYVGGACDYTAWGGPYLAGGTGDNLLGTCGGANHGPGVRTALGNWSTYVSKFTP